MYGFTTQGLPLLLAHAFIMKMNNFLRDPTCFRRHCCAKGIPSSLQRASLPLCISVQHLACMAVPRRMLASGRWCINWRAPSLHAGFLKQSLNGRSITSTCTRVLTCLSAASSVHRMSSLDLLFFVGQISHMPAGSGWARPQCAPSC